MSKRITEHEGKKYLRTIRSAVYSDEHVQIDFYAIIVACNVTCPARVHALKKILFAGERKKGDTLADLIGAEAALSRAIELEKTRIELEKARAPDIKPPEFTEKEVKPIPIPMLLYCPGCGGQHIDKNEGKGIDWSTHPHRTHLCHYCGKLFQPADVPTVGVDRLQNPFSDSRKFDVSMLPLPIIHSDFHFDMKTVEASRIPTMMDRWMDYVTRIQTELTEARVLGDHNRIAEAEKRWKQIEDYCKITIEWEKEDEEKEVEEEKEEVTPTKEELLEALHKDKLGKAIFDGTYPMPKEKTAKLTKESVPNSADEKK